MDARGRCGSSSSPATDESEEFSLKPKTQTVLTVALEDESLTECPLPPWGRQTQIVSSTSCLMLRPSVSHGVREVLDLDLTDGLRNETIITPTQKQKAEVETENLVHVGEKRPKHNDHKQTWNNLSLNPTRPLQLLLFLPAFMLTR